MVVDYCGLGNGAFIQTLEKNKIKIYIDIFLKGKKRKIEKAYLPHTFFLPSMHTRHCAPAYSKGNNPKDIFFIHYTIHVRAMSKLLFTKHTAPLHAEQRKTYLYGYTYTRILIHRRRFVFFLFVHRTWFRTKKPYDKMRFFFTSTTANNL